MALARWLPHNMNHHPWIRLRCRSCCLWLAPWAILFFASPSTASPALRGTVRFQETYSGDDTVDSPGYIVHNSGQLSITLSNVALAQVSRLSRNNEGQLVGDFDANFYIVPETQDPSPQFGSADAQVQGERVYDSQPTPEGEQQGLQPFKERQVFTTSPGSDPGSHFPELFTGGLTVTLAPDGTGTASFKWGMPILEQAFITGSDGVERSQGDPGTNYIGIPFIPFSAGVPGGGEEPATGPALLRSGILGAQYTWSDSATYHGVTVTDTVTVDLTGQLLVDLSIPNAPGDKQKVGGLVVRHITAQADPDGDNQAPRQWITVDLDRSMVQQGAVMLDDPGLKVRIHTDPKKDSPLAFDGKQNRFDASTLPKSLWVEGIAGSDAMRDVTLTAELVGSPAVKDAVTFTVLDVEQPAVQSGKISSDNTAYQNLWKAYTKYTWGNLWQTISNPDLLRGKQTLDAADSLGLHAYQNLIDGPAYTIVGYGVEGKALVHPPDFSYPGVHLQLARDADAMGWIASPWPSGTPSGTQAATFDSSTDPPWNDADPSGDANNRDDDPSPDGAIYDLDAPGRKFRLDQPQPYHHSVRLRANFKLWGAVELQPKQWVRCSPIKKYWIGTSWVQIDNLRWYVNGSTTPASLMPAGSQPPPPGSTILMGGTDYVPLGDVPGDNTLRLDQFGPESWDLR